MASVSGLLQVRVRQAKGLDAAPAAALTVRLRLLPWKEEQSSDTAQCDDDGTAEWALSDANLVVLPHLAAHDEAQPQLSIDLRSRELLVYERCLGLTTIDAQPLLIPGEENEMWISLNEANLRPPQTSRPGNHNTDSYRADALPGVERGCPTPTSVPIAVVQHAAVVCGM